MRRLASMTTAIVMAGLTGCDIGAGGAAASRPAPGLRRCPFPPDREAVLGGNGQGVLRPVPESRSSLAQSARTTRSGRDSSYPHRGYPPAAGQNSWTGPARVWPAEVASWR